MFLIKNCSVTRIFNKSMEHVGTKKIVPYQLYVPPLEGSLLEVLLYYEANNVLLHGRHKLVVAALGELQAGQRQVRHT